MSWADVSNQGSNAQENILKIEPNTAKLFHVMEGEPHSFWTHYIPNVGGAGKAKGLVVVCPGRSVCPACKINKYRSRKRHAMNVYDYASKSVKILEQGNQVMEQLRMIHDQYKGLATVDISIRRTGEGRGTQYFVVPMPNASIAGYDWSQVGTLHDVAEINRPTTADEVARIMEDMEVPANPGQQGEAIAAGPPPAQAQASSVDVQTPGPAPEQSVTHTPIVPSPTRILKPTTGVPPAQAQAPVVPPATAGQQPVPTPQQSPAPSSEVAQPTIAPVVNDVVSPEDTPLPFGKYNGESLAQIMKHDPDYVKWCSSNMSDPVIKATAQQLIAGTGTPPPTEPDPLVAEADAKFSEGSEEMTTTANDNLIIKIEHVLNTNPTYTRSFEAILAKMKEATAGGTFPNGKTQLNDFTNAELVKLQSIL